MHLRFGTAAIAAAGFAALTLGALPASATFFGTKDGPAIGIGSSCASLMTSSHRNPLVASDLQAIHDETVEAIQAGSYGVLKDLPQGVALYKAAQIELVADEGGVVDSLAVIAAACDQDLAALRSTRPDRAAVAIAEMCVAAINGIAGQPAAEAAILATYAEGVQSIASLGPRSSVHVKAEAFGMVKAAQIAGAAQAPATAAALAAAADTCKADILRF
jgi:hypothetical protein